MEENELLNKYGNIHHESELRLLLDNVYQSSKKVTDFLESKNCPPHIIKAIAHDMVMTVTSSVSTSLLKTQINMRKEKRNSTS